MKRSLRIIGTVGFFILIAFVLAIGIRPSRPRGDAVGHAELHRLGQVHQGAWSGRPSPSEHFVAALHFTAPSNYYLGRYQAQRQALVDSGYLTDLTVSIPDLKPQVVQVLGVLSNTSTEAHAYAHWTFDTPNDELRLLCRTQDVALWEQTLAPFSK